MKMEAGNFIVLFPYQVKLSNKPRDIYALGFAVLSRMINRPVTIIR